MSDGFGTGEDGPRRFLIATAVSRYPKCPDWDRPGLEAARQDVVDLFTGVLGYRHQSALGLDPTRAQLTDQLRAFCKSADRREDDLLAVYVSGHGEVLDDGGDHVLFTSDTDPDDIAYSALPTVDLARTILRDTKVRKLLLVLDTCYSGQGGNELAAAALERINSQWAQAATGSGLVIVSSAQPHQQAATGIFPRLLTQAVASRSTAGHGPEALSVSAVVQHMNGLPDRPGHQRISLAQIGLTGDPPPFLANPRHSIRLTDVDLAVQQATEFDAYAQRRETELTTRLLVRAMGYHGDGAQGWWFCGRHAVLHTVAAWLRTPATERPPACTVVTAGPGSGKTAVLGMIAAMAHPERRRTVPMHRLGLDPSDVAEEGSVDVAIYAQSLTDTDVLQGLAAAAGVRVTSVGELLEALEAQQRERPFTALIDALDEAATPLTLASQILRPLIDHSKGRIRLLLGTRPYLLDRLGILPNRPGSTEVISLDDPRYADPKALHAYTIRNLIEAHPNSPYREVPRALRRVSRAVAEAAGLSFLVARITAGTLAAAHDVVSDPDNPTWRASLPRLPSQAMHKDLTQRLGLDAQRAADLLRPLAFAQGQGLPWEDLWAPLASAISGRTYTDDDLLWLRRNAGSYVVEATEADRSAYRLYHQALAEHLRDGTDPQTIHTAFTDVLTDRVPYHADGTRDWSRAHPYTLTHLAFHATTAGRLDDLLNQPEYLVHATAHTLTPHLHHATTDTSRLAAAVYRTSAGHHAQLPAARRRRVLALDAARAGATDLHRQLIQSIPDGEWVPRWATGSGFTPALRNTLTGLTIAVACTVLDGIPVAVTGSSDDTVRVWDLVTGQPVGEPLTGHTDMVRAVACAVLDGVPVAVTAGDDGTVRVWDLLTGQPAFEALAGPPGPVGAVACTVVDGAPVAVIGSFVGTVRVWDLVTGQPVGEPLIGHTDEVGAVACTVVDGAPVAVTSSLDSTVRVWDLATGRPVGEPQAGHTDEVLAVACTVVDGAPVAVTSSLDSTVRVWDLVTGQPVGEPLTGHTSSVFAVACAVLDGAPVAVTASHDRTVRIWDLATVQPVGEPLTGHTSSVFAVACTVLDGVPVAVTASDDRTVRIWNLRTRQLSGLIDAAGPVTVSIGVDGFIVVGIDRDVAVFARRSPRMPQ